jgi:ankyrin repeat protein
MRRIALVLAVLSGALATPAFASFYDLLDAARQDDLATVRSLLAAGEQVDPFGPGDGYSPLQFAAQHGNIEMVRLLLEAGADSEYRDHNGDRALLWAADEGQAEAIRLLLDAGSPPNSPDDPYGRSPLMQAAASDSPAAVTLLLDAGANLHARDQSDLTPLHYAAWQGDAQIIELLLAAGANPNANTDTLHETPLHYAANHPDMAAALIAGGIAPDARNHDGRTALHIAAYAGTVESVRVLLDGYARPDIATNSGVTALMLAAEKGHVEIARLLLDHGASKTALDDNGHAAVYYLSNERAEPGLNPNDLLDLTGIDTPRNRVTYRPSPSPEEAARLAANHAAIREMLEAD